MNHTDRCQALIQAAEAAGYLYYMNERGKASQPDNCAQGYIFYPKSGGDENYQMFRGYVHDTEDIVYLRVNWPGVEFGLGMKPFEIDLGLIAEPVLGIDNVAMLNSLVKQFFSTTLVPTRLIEHLIAAENRKIPKNYKEETVNCSLCHGAGIFERHGIGDPCKLCYGKGQRTLATETYYIRD